MIGHSSYPMIGRTAAVNTRARSLALSPALLLLCIFSGCGSPETGTSTSNASVSVRYQGQPIADVVVRLHSELNGPPLTQAITDASGNASQFQLPSPEPPKYFVTLESVSDGGWILDLNAIERTGIVLELSSFNLNPIQNIELPPQSVQPL
ncbi:hypothetical protein Pla22_36610 [Rubripirellula amarantea]|uniref:Nickel uptake substrate-specific transmembrane region n=1 Tax=Rubripirellula amarantea TaxID=2527999 RepID=A0A5C5WJH7_9BACT|nr:hypothetical protein [Rubripirellula amarantea]TWT50918.1 hypothetical protein Pla22_36610 [Rubripirellula amarantea]